VDQAVNRWVHKFLEGPSQDGLCKDHTDLFILDSYREGKTCRDIEKLLGNAKLIQAKKYKDIGKSQISTRLNKILTKAGIEPEVFR